MRVEWSPLAEEAWQEIANYIFDTFGIQALLDYSEITDTWMDTLVNNPLVASKEELLAHRSKNYRSIAIHKLSKVIYYIENEVVYIADVWDTRRSPKTLTRRLQ